MKVEQIISDHGAMAVDGDADKTTVADTKSAESPAEMSGVVKDETKDKNTDSMTKAPDHIVSSNPDAKSTTEKVRTDNNDDFSLHVKPEYILSERAECLGPLAAHTSNPDSRSNNTDDKTGKSKKRPRDERIAAADKVCVSVIRGVTCPYGDTCRFSHDLASFMKTRPTDLTTSNNGDPVTTSCYLYDTYGHCPYGVMCRFGSAHLDMDTGENKKKDDCKPIVAPLNTPDKGLVIKLRKKKYHFQTMRYDDKRQQKNKPTDESTPKVEASTSLDPLPTKRKTIDFYNKVYVAPLTTVGNLPFRRVMKRLGADITCGEMALASNLLQGNTSEWALLKRHPEEDVFGVQLAGGYADLFTRAAEVLEREEDLKVDFVDINMGCPIDLVCNKGAGASLMMRDKRLHGILSGMTSVLSCPVTVKMRTGWDSNHPLAHQLMEKVSSWNVDGIGAFMVHGRSRLQRYSKQADWEYISKVAMTVHKSNGSFSGEATSSIDPANVKIPVIGNGDIYSYQDYVDSTAQPGVAPCAMLARGALIKPWLPTEIKEKRVWDISATERFDILKDFVHFGLEHWGSDQQGVNNTRRFLLEWLSFLHRYVPVGLLKEGDDYKRPQMNHRPPTFMKGRNELETLFLSDHSDDWVKISERLLGPVPEGFRFEAKHKARGYNK